MNSNGETMADDDEFDPEIKKANREMQRERMAGTIDRLNSQPMEGLRFSDFTGLSVGGSDEFSRVKLSALSERVSHSDFEQVRGKFANDDKAQASCLRWILRGLNCDKAIRKVSTDNEVAQNAAGRRRR